MPEGSREAYAGTRSGQSPQRRVHRAVRREEGAMNLCNWLPTAKPRHSMQDVVRELIKGLRNGAIELDNTAPPQGDGRATQSQEPVRTLLPPDKGHAPPPRLV